ncbi:uncharacterized protein [Littorina saxatilis]|uniref:uncharacterized protein n=1 Tax=Littorina saxatilis TaxID=31220 RepID=UPI0038B4CAF6
MHHIKRFHINKKRCEAYRAKNEIRKKIPISQLKKCLPSPLSATQTSGSSGVAVRSANSRFCKKFLEILPTNPAVRGEVISAGLRALSPNSKNIVNSKLGVFSPTTKQKLEFDSCVASALREEMEKIKKQRSVKALRLRRLYAKSILIKNKSLAKHMGISYKLRNKVASARCSDGWEDDRATRKDALPESTVNEVIHFFENGLVSKDLPDARSAIVEGGSVQPRKVMETSLRSAYEEFRQQDGAAISFSSFKRLKPRRVLPFTSHKFRECLCEYCVNIDLKCAALNSHLSNEPELKIRDHFEASRITLCPKEEGVYKKACIDRQCDNCGPALLRERLHLVLENETLRNSPATWWQWENVAITNTSTRMTKVRKEGSFQGLVEALQSALVPFFRHLFNAKWQYEQYCHITRTVPRESVILCMDYAENYTAKQQDAPQGFHWNNTQTTVHPVVATYKCKQAGCDLVTTDSIVFVSDDLTHDHHGVQHYMSKTVEMLLADNLVFTRVIAFSDGAPTQYKNRIGFVDCSFAQSDMGVKTERHFFGSRHGKGPCDRETGVIKKSVNRAAAAGRAEVPSPKTFYDFCTKSLSLPRAGTDEHSHIKRRFVYVPAEDVNRHRPERTGTKPLKNTQRLHCVKGIQPFVVATRERSCFCQGCQEDADCENAEIAGDWNVSRLAPPRRRQARADQPTAPGHASPVQLPQQPAAPVHLPDQPATPGHLPNQPGTPGHLPDQPATPVHLPHQPGHLPHQPATSGHLPDQPATPVHLPDQPTTPGHQPDQPATPVHLPHQPATPAHLPHRCLGNGFRKKKKIVLHV